ncbi:MAG: macro domain-containing protein [Alphaproteobacteria bacterium]|nr:macro domain-containing protein [Alphaproteobacteria bacterium]
MKKIKKIDVEIVSANIACMNVDVVVVPEFQGCASYGGVGRAVAQAAAQGMHEYDTYAKAQPFSLGSATLTPAGSVFCRYLAHVVTVGCSREDSFKCIKTAVEKALVLADLKGAKSIAIPAVGTGVIGSLTLKQSAKAVFGAVAEFASLAQNISQVKFVIYRGDPQPAEEVLMDESYLTDAPEVGEKEFSLGAWLYEMCSRMNNETPETGC